VNIREEGISSVVGVFSASRVVPRFRFLSFSLLAPGSPQSISLTPESCPSFPARTPLLDFLLFTSPLPFFLCRLAGGLHVLLRVLDLIVFFSLSSFPPFRCWSLTIFSRFLPPFFASVGEIGNPQHIVRRAVFHFSSSQRNSRQSHLPPSPFFCLLPYSCFFFFASPLSFRWSSLGRSLGIAGSDPPGFPRLPPITPVFLFLGFPNQ